MNSNTGPNFNGELNYELEDATSVPPQTVVVQGEEIGIIVMLLLLWIGAIALFFHRWGKIRMLEPYQPKFYEGPPRPVGTITVLESPTATIGHFPRSLSKYNVNLNDGSISTPYFAKCVVNQTIDSVNIGGVSGITTCPVQVSSQLASTHHHNHHYIQHTQIPQRSRLNSIFVPIPSSARRNSTRFNTIMTGKSLDCPTIPDRNGSNLNEYGNGRKAKSDMDLTQIVITEELKSNAPSILGIPSCSNVALSSSDSQCYSTTSKDQMDTIVTQL